MSDVPPVAATTDPNAVAPPPPTVAGQVALTGEAQDTNEDGEDTRAVLTLRDRGFHLRSGVPQMLMNEVTAAAAPIPALAKKDPKTYTERDTEKLTKAAVAIHNALVKLVVVDEREDFIEYASEVEPPVEAEELSGLLAKAVEAISGRPTKAS